MLRLIKHSLVTSFLLAIPMGTILIGGGNQSAMAGCNPFGCSQSSAAECNPFGCPNSPLGVACSPFGCPASPQPAPSNNPPAPNPSIPTVLIAPPNQQSTGGSADAIVKCMNGLLYRPAKVCTASTPYSGHCIQYGDGFERTEISQATAAQACQGAH